MALAKDITGQRFGRLVAVKRTGSSKGRPLWELKCDCGNITHLGVNPLTKGNTTSCGCYHREMMRDKLLGVNLSGSGFDSARAKHLESGKTTTEYNTWLGMKQRCYYLKHVNYKNYGARGVTVCDEWRDNYLQFLSDMGRKPKDKDSLDRIDCDGPYAPWNCRWATHKEQAANRRPRNSIA